LLIISRFPHNPDQAKIFFVETNAVCTRMCAWWC